MVNCTVICYSSSNEQLPHQNKIQEVYTYKFIYYSKYKIQYIIVFNFYNTLVSNCTKFVYEFHIRRNCEKRNGY